MSDNAAQERIQKALADVPEAMREPLAAYVESMTRLSKALEAPLVFLTDRGRIKFLREQQAAATQFADDVERFLGALSSKPSADEQ